MVTASDNTPTDKVREILAHLPDAPGVYLMKGESGGILYVGKAKSLKKRVRSYFQRMESHTPRTRIMVRKVRDIETVVTAGEVEALVLENNLIKRHRPTYNVMLRDDKNYPYIRLSVHEDFPRLTVVRKVKNDGARYYGPYVGAGSMRATLRVIHAHFPLADCDIVIDGKLDRPCLQFQIGRCKAPCTGYQSREDYNATVAEVRMFLEGKDRELERVLKSRMQAASEALEFERAATLRDQIRQIRATLVKQRITTPGGGDVDAFGLARAGGWTALQALFVREGALVGNKAFVWQDSPGADGESGLAGVSDAELYATFIKQFYAGDVPVPSRLMVPVAIAEADAVAEWLTGLRGKKCEVVVPARGRGPAFLALAKSNAENALDGRLKSERAGERGLVALQKTLRLAAPPRRIEGFDISHISGDLTVASMVVWEGAGPKKADYRHFRIRGVEGPDDFLSMYEVVSRHYGKLIRDSLPLPNLILIDGGKGQLSMAVKALAEAGVPTPPDGPAVIGLAKERGEKFERVFMPGRKDAAPLKPGAPATRILQQIRDEAHRFAVTYHRKLRSLRIKDSELDAIPGIGKTRKKALLTAFGSVAGLKKARLDEIAALKGMTQKTAGAVWNALHAKAAGEGDDAPAPKTKRIGDMTLTPMSPRDGKRKA
ncbi:MAG: excinuclease ABC subunit UvrC [Leptospirillia bacterium]